MSRSTSISMSWPMTSLISRPDLAADCPGSERPSTHASAKPGMTLVLAPARSTVGTAVFDSVAASAAATPLSGTLLQQEVGHRAVVQPRQQQRVGELLRRRDRAQIAVDDGGAVLRQARARQLGRWPRRSCATALLLARHRAVPGTAGGAQLHPDGALLGHLDRIDDARRSCAPRSRPLRRAQNSARTSSGWWSTSQREPWSQPASSSATPAKMRSRSSVTPSFLSRASTSADITAMCFMSMAPRPQR